MTFLSPRSADRPIPGTNRACSPAIERGGGTFSSNCRGDPTASRQPPATSPSGWASPWRPNRIRRSPLPSCDCSRPRRSGRILATQRVPARRVPGGFWEPTCVPTAQNDLHHKIRLFLGIGDPLSWALRPNSASSSRRQLLQVQALSGRSTASVHPAAACACSIVIFAGGLYPLLARDRRGPPGRGGPVALAVGRLDAGILVAILLGEIGPLDRIEILRESTS